MTPYDILDLLNSPQNKWIALLPPSVFMDLSLSQQRGTIM